MVYYVINIVPDRSVLNHAQCLHQEVPALDAEVKRWHEKLKAFDNLENLRDNLAKLKDKWAWAIVAEVENVSTVHSLFLYCY